MYTLYTWSYIIYLALVCTLESFALCVVLKLCLDVHVMLCVQSLYVNGSLKLCSDVLFSPFLCCWVVFRCPVQCLYALLCLDVHVLCNPNMHYSCKMVVSSI